MSPIRDSASVEQHLVIVIYPKSERIEVVRYHQNGETKKIVLRVPVNM